MALFYRASSNIYLLLNNPRCKILYNHVGVNSILIGLKQNYSVNNDMIFKVHENTKQDKPQSSKNNECFENVMKSRRTEAKKSILVQVNSKNSCNDLYNYCMKFGNVLSMHYFVTKSQKHMILVEFSSSSAIKEVKRSAAFQHDVMPTRTSALWFRNTRKTEFRTTHTFDKHLIMGDIRIDDASLKQKLISANSISNQIVSLYDELKLSDLCTRLRFYTASYLEQNFTALFPNIVFHPFGSSVNGFGKKLCDLDLAASLDDQQNNNPSRLIFQTKVFVSYEAEHVRKVLNVFSDSLNYFVPGISHVRKIFKARVPIIKLLHSYVDLECDLSFSNMSAVYMSELLFLYGEIDSRVRPLVVTVRRWAECQGVTNYSPGPWISNFSLTLLVLFFLQNKTVLPSLNSLKKHTSITDERYVVDIGDCSFPRDIKRLRQLYKNPTNRDSLQNLLMGFFEFYSNFDFDKDAICIQRGTVVNKSELRPLHIVNPLQSTLNVSPNVSLEEVLRFKALSYQALDILQSSQKKHNNTWGLQLLLSDSMSTKSQNEKNGKLIMLNKILQSDSDSDSEISQNENDNDKVDKTHNNFVKDSSILSTAIKRR